MSISIREAKRAKIIEHTYRFRWQQTGRKGWDLWRLDCTSIDVLWWEMLVLVHGICRQYQSLTVDEGCVDNDGLLVGVLVGWGWSVRVDGCGNDNDWSTEYNKCIANSQTWMGSIIIDRDRGEEEVVMKHGGDKSRNHQWWQRKHTLVGDWVGDCGNSH